MAVNLYHFEDHWHIPFAPEDVWEVLSKSEEYPVWWKGVYLSAEPLGKAGPNRIGRRVAIVARGWLPYRLHFTIETLALQKPNLIEFKARETS